MLNLPKRTKEGIETPCLAGNQISAVAGKKLIRKYSRDYDGTLTDKDCIKVIGIARNTYYRYKAEMKEEYRSPGQNDRG